MNFADFARAHGLLIRDLYADGRIHRCPTASHPRSTNGAYKWCGEWGWLQDWAEHAEPIIWREEGVSEEVVRRDIANMRREEQERRDRAARLAAAIVGRCTFDVHPYLASKGFPNEQGLIDTDGRLVIPMRDCSRYGRVVSVQFINAAGEKKFLTGGSAKGAVFFIGSGPEYWLCEGYATALSVRAALAELYRPARVVVCFSAGNLATVAGRLEGRRFVIADNDASGTGQRYAEATGLPWVMAPEVGHDANDMMVKHGTRAVADLLRGLLRQ